MSELSVKLVSPPVSSATISPMGVTIVDPESPPLEKEPVSFSCERMGDLERLYIAGGEVLPRIRLEPIERADGGVRAEAALDNATNAIALQVQAVRIVDLIGGEHASETKETIFGVLELRRDVDTFVHE